MYQQVVRGLQSTFADSKVLVTGHSGFKGSWLSFWLTSLGARVVGVSRDVPTEPSHFKAASLAGLLDDCRVDIRDATALKTLVREHQPDFVFHLAAQSLVRRSYADPLETWQTNTLGTVHVLQALREMKKPCVAILITSDKCYDNVDWVWGYRENDRLGGPDPYSASKGAAELAIRSYVQSYFAKDGLVRIGVGRAGNVIGGGDWAENRLVPDCVRAWSNGETVQSRNPLATRPWQHVLEPLSGYLALACALAKSPKLHGEAFNFGPRGEQNYSVRALLEALADHWPGAQWRDASEANVTYQEAGLLKLNCDKALHQLCWQPTLDFAETVRLTAQWYRTFYADPSSLMREVTLNQLRTYVGAAQKKGIQWTCQ